MRWHRDHLAAMLREMKPGEAKERVRARYIEAINHLSEMENG